MHMISIDAINDHMAAHVLSSETRAKGPLVRFQKSRGHNGLSRILPSR